MLRFALPLALLVAAPPAMAQERTEAEVKGLALEAILENPEVIVEAIEMLRRRDAEEAQAEAQATLGESRDLLERDPNAPVLGNPNGDVTVVEFFDYNCPYCRRAGDEVAALLEADPDVRLVYREWPILSEGSLFAARAALAAREQDLYAQMHEAMMDAQGRLDETSVMAIAEEVGLDTAQLRTDMEAPEVQEHIRTSMELAQSLGFSGTPSFVVGDTTAPGLVDAEQLQAMVEDARDDN
ncbi:Thiol-disulfide oxidoreductase D [Jannaschia seosinensis]|uniref:Thiol-disulfide oxidoreductase D n=1 Tax=Jannaschia seosinensis TaxID=313367 RepID=A0A0M7BFI4_9RHOB|nr:DsbA family protein [Jannaschia seosinensis]CUH40135.1 Thiol-disulfide oxidoreductase D [Jannaschia seosinensis]